MPRSDNDRVKSLEKGLRLLLLLSERGEAVNLDRITQASGLNKTTCHRLLGPCRISALWSRRRRAGATTWAPGTFPWARRPCRAFPLIRHDQGEVAERFALLVKKNSGRNDIPAPGLLCGSGGPSPGTFPHTGAATGLFLLFAWSKRRLLDQEAGQD